jgi:hypothetical protein
MPMSTTTTRAWLLIGAPLAFAALLKFHPMQEGDFFTGVSENLTPWLAVHFGAAALFPLMAYVIWVLIRDLRGRAATTARIALPIYAVVYGVWEAVMGLASGLMAQQAKDMTGAERDGVAQAVNAIPTHPIFGDGTLLVGIGSVAWITAITAAIVALRAAGVRRAALVLLGISTFMSIHVAPIGPAALLCLSGAAFMIERHRRSAALNSLRPLPA